MDNGAPKPTKRAAPRAAKKPPPSSDGRDTSANGRARAAGTSGSRRVNGARTDNAATGTSSNGAANGSSSNGARRAGGTTGTGRPRQPMARAASARRPVDRRDDTTGGLMLAPDAPSLDEDGAVPVPTIVPAIPDRPFEEPAVADVPSSVPVAPEAPSLPPPLPDADEAAPPTALVAPLAVPTGVVPVVVPVAPFDELATGEPLDGTPLVPMRPLRAPVTFRRRSRPRVRRVTRVIRHVDTWSVFKVALVFNIFLYVVCLTSGVLLWQVAQSTGTVDNVENFFKGFGWEVFELKGGEIYHQMWIAGLFVVVALTGLAVLIATLFNLITDLVGGIRVSVLEEEVVSRIERGTQRSTTPDQ